MRNILVLSTSYPSTDNDPSGVFIAKLLEAIRKRGYSIRVVAPSDGTFHGRRAINGIETIRFGYFFPRSLERLTVGLGGIPENLEKSVLARLQLAPMMLVFLIVALREARRSDIIYANWLGAGIIGAVVNLVMGRPLVVSFRGDDGYLARDRRLWRTFTKWVTERAAMVAPVSTELSEIMCSLGTPREKCRVPRFGVDTEMFRPPSVPRANGTEVRVLYVGALIPKKGVQDLIDALAAPVFGNVRLIVAGDGHYASDLKCRCEKKGIQERAEWKGLVSPREVAELMRASDILCLPSYTEGTPNVVKEAMASGLPVIATRVGGIPDLVGAGETGLLFEPGNVNELRQCLEALVNDPDRRAEMGRTGFEVLTAAGLSWDATAEDFDSIFAAIMQND
jgi:glycosyltransferase involved in cell wall biosynthesis